MMCALRKKKCCGAEDKQEAADNHFTPPVVLGCAAGVVTFSPRRSLIHRLMTEIPTPEEDLSFCPSAELRGKDL